MRATVDTAFLTEHPCPRPISIVAADRVWAATLYLGHGRSPLEVVAVVGDRPITDGEMNGAWKARKAQRAAPVMLIWLHPAGEGARAIFRVDEGAVTRCAPGDIERVALVALSSPDRHAALLVIRQHLAALCD